MSRFRYARGMRHAIAVSVLLVACGGGGTKARVSGGAQASAAQRVPGGARVPVPSLVEMLGALRDEDAGPQLLARAIFERCGQACACLDFSEPGDPEARFAMCRDVWKDQAAAAGGYDWRASLSEGKMGSYRMARPAEPASTWVAGGAEHSATGTFRPVPREALVIVADGAAPAGRLVEALALSAQSAIAVVQRDELRKIALVFHGAQSGERAGGFGYTRAGGVPGRVELLIEVAAASFLVGDAVSGERQRVDAADPEALGNVITRAMQEAPAGERRDVVVSVRDEARVAQVVAAVDAALAAGAHGVRVESWYERPEPAEPAEPASPGTASGRTAPTVPAVRIGGPATGDLDKQIIRRYIRREIPKITLCYEKRLVDKPGLAGTVTAKFFITPGGSVSTSEATGVDPEVARCIAAVIKQIKFPKPKGGGGVNVSYPFTFRSTD